MTHLTLVGAGHAHLHLVTRAAELRRAGIATTVVSPPHFAYSGMGSAVAGGAVGPAANRIDVEALCDRHGVAFVPGRATALDHTSRTLAVDDDRELTTDLLSLNVGSDPATGGIDVGDEVVRVKPLVGLAGLPARLDRLGAGARVTIVGGGASAAEIAANLAHRLARRPELGRRVHVLGRSALPVEAAGRQVATRIHERLTGLGVTWHGGTTVTAVDGARASTIDDRGSATHRHDLAVLAVGLAPSAAVARLGLAAEHGHLPVDRHLTHPDHDWVLGAGDAARFLPRPLPKVGVFGVRAGPALAAVLLARARGGAVPAFEPQEDHLAILDLATTGVAVRGTWWHEGRSALVTKRLVDRRWMARYR